LKTDLKGRIALLALGHTADQIMTKGFDYVLYPAVMIWLGFAWGTIMMIFCSFLVCFATMKFYDWSKKDWLGIELLKQVREEHREGSRFSRILSWALRKGDWVVMIILSVYKDPFITTVYMRKGVNKYNGMGLREWKVFITSLIISNLWWTILVNISLSSVKALWQAVVG
jgi:hypothetical protein